MKIKKSLIYMFALAILLITGSYNNVNADLKQNDYNSNEHNTIILDNNGSDIIIFPDASNDMEQISNYVKSLSNKLNNTKSELNNAKKQLSDSKDKRSKNNATKRINKTDDKLAKLNNSKTFILNDFKQAIKSFENKKKNAKTDEEHINANVSLNRSKIGYSELNKVLK